MVRIAFSRQVAIDNRAVGVELEQVEVIRDVCHRTGSVNLLHDPIQSNGPLAIRVLIVHIEDVGATLCDQGVAEALLRDHVVKERTANA